MGKPIERKYMSPFAPFGEELNLSSNLFFKLKAKGDKVRFRILGVPYYEGKHFLKDGDDWNIVPCPRINDHKECEYCKKFFSIQNDIKKMEANKEPEDVVKAAKKEAKKYGATVSVYYPIINRDTQSFQIFQTGLSVRQKVEAELKLGTKVLERDFIVLRTEEPGSNYYTLSKMDSTDTPTLTDKEREEVAKYEQTNLEDIVVGVKGKEDELDVTKDDSINF